MLEERYVSYELAELLDSKGFDGKCRAYYRKHDKIFLYKVPAPAELDGYTCNRKWTKRYSEKNHCDYILAPTLQMVVEFLGKKGIEVIVDVCKVGEEHRTMWSWTPVLVKKDHLEYPVSMYDGSVYGGLENSKAEAYDKGIRYCLEML